MVEFIARFQTKQSAEEAASNIHSAFDNSYNKLDVNVDDTKLVISGIRAIVAYDINNEIKRNKSLVYVQF